MALTSSDENRLGEWLAWRKRLVWRPVGFDWASLSLLYKSDVLAVNKNDCDHVVLSRKGSSSRRHVTEDTVRWSGNIRGSEVWFHSSFLSFFVVLSLTPILPLSLYIYRRYIFYKVIAEWETMRRNNCLPYDDVQREEDKITVIHNIYIYEG